MPGADVRLWFGQAYQYMASGDFASAAKYFEKVINDGSDPYASSLAEQRLRWYCLPLDAILKKMDECHNPIDVHSVLADLFTTDSQYVESDQMPIIQAIEEGLGKLTSVIQLGYKVWAKKEIFNALLEKLAREIQQSQKPITISIWIKDQFINCDAPDNFPDHITLGAFESGLKEFPIVIFAQEYAITKTALSSQIDLLAQCIRSIGKLVPISTLIETLFPGGSHELETKITPSFCNHLDARFIEVTQGNIFLTELFKLNSDTFENLFVLSPNPHSTDILACYSLYSEKVSKTLTQRFHLLAEQQLAQNKNLQKAGQSKWVTKKLAQDLYSKAEKYLVENGNLQKSQTILDAIWQIDSISFETRNLLIDLLEDLLRNSKDVISLGSQIWIHLTILRQAIDKSYQHLLHSKKTLSTDELIKYCLNLKTHHITQVLILNFENILQKDGRFILESWQTPHQWRAIDPLKRDNQKAQEILEKSHKIFTLEEIKSILISDYGIPSPVINLKNDDRFKIFPPDHWGLNEWVLINDKAYEYLLTLRHGLHEIAIIGSISRMLEIKEEFAIFIPTEDTRFAKDTINRWFCRYMITDAEMDLFHEELVKYGGTGRKIDYLTSKLLHKDANATDAENCLQKDKRFICLDNLWFARCAAFYAITIEDIEKIYNTLTKLADSRGAVSVKELVQRAIGHDGRLTDAATLLKKDSRFINVHDDFWALTNAAIPDFSRSGVGGVAIPNQESDQPIMGGDGDIGKEKLTLRKGKQPKSEAKPELIKKIYITLKTLDIRHGNLHIAGILKEWIPNGAKNIHFKDEEDYEFIAFIDETGLIFNIDEWLKKRNLTYGDKISIQPIFHEGELFIQPYGKRDEGAYQEALNHQKIIDKLIEEAREVNKSFHDLMIEVMEEFNCPLHREDIYQLVNYQRTASRNTISEILSIPDCPFEELRYFRPVGEGTWIFSRKRKEAYDMKMQELLTENGELQTKLIALQTQLESQKGAVEKKPIFSVQLEQLQQVIAETNDEVERLQKEKIEFERDNGVLRGQLDTMQAQMAKDQTDYEGKLAARQQEEDRYDQEKAQLEETIKSLKDQVESLNNQINELEQQSIRKRDLESELEEVKKSKDNTDKEINRLRKESAAQVEKSKVDLEAARAINEQLLIEIDNARGEIETNTGKLNIEIEAAKFKEKTLELEIKKLTKENAEVTEKLEADRKTSQDIKINLEIETEKLRQESTTKINQLEAELAIAQTKINQAAESERISKPMSFKEILQALSTLLFHKKS